MVWGGGVLFDRNDQFFLYQSNDYFINNQSLSAWFHYYQFSNIALWNTLIAFNSSGERIVKAHFFFPQKWILSGLWLILFLKVCIDFQPFFTLAPGP